MPGIPSFLSRMRALFLDAFGQDLRVALRGFRRTPTFAVTAVLVLTIGIGMASAMSTVFDAVLLRRLPVRDEDRLAVLWTSTVGNVEYASSPEDIEELKKDSRTAIDFAGFGHYGSAGYPLTDADRVLTMSRTPVTGNFFDVLGAKAALGRLLRPDDDHTNAPQVIVLSYDAWRREFAGDSSVVGRQLADAYTRAPVTVVGVASPGFAYPVGVEYWTTLSSASGYNQLDIVARLAPGATIVAARAEVFDKFSRLHPEHHLVGAAGLSLRDAILGDVRPVLIVVMVAVALLLTIACVNVGNLLLMRGAGRTREFSIRRALGARPRDIVRQLLVESALLAAVGGALGVLAASALVRILVLLAPSGLPRTDTIGIHGPPLAIAIGVTGLTALLFGVFPALSAGRGDDRARLELRNRSSSESRPRRQLRRTLVGVQVALAIVTLAAAGLLVRSLGRLQELRLGYTASHLSVLDIACSVQACSPRAKFIATGEAISSKWRAVAGVETTSPILAQPFFGNNVWAWGFTVEGMTPTQAEIEPRIPVEMGGKDFFRTMGIPLVRGRGFEDADREDAPLVVVVSEAVAHHFWPNDDPIGKRIRTPVSKSFIPGGNEWRTVVGVVNDTHFRNLRETSPMIYLPWRQGYWQGVFAVRTTADLGSVLPILRREVRAVDPSISVWNASTMDDLLAAPLATPRLSALLVGAFGLVSLLLAAIGLYGVMTSAVREETRDIGVRLALGASPGRIRREVLTRSLSVTSGGMLAGLVCALAASRLLTGLLFEVSPADPLALLGASGLLLAVAGAAAYLPARWATKVDPVQALRAD